MTDLGWGRPGGKSGNNGSGGGQGSGGSVRTVHEYGVSVGNGSGLEGARKASGGCVRGAR
ncbi:hypothetical protein [Streptomyces sp. NRRL S-646]|uniref:hypothetical protein n=1 Tax=Streptomyces sp. NRRL S-646 TaxID=1463917 RepID=UPI000A51DF9A|nr:hypothetical protein [Streptomyces sp. NRRL S-646]